MYLNIQKTPHSKDAVLKSLLLQTSKSYNMLELISHGHCSR